MTAFRLARRMTTLSTLTVTHRMENSKMKSRTTRVAAILCAIALSSLTFSTDAFALPITIIYTGTGGTGSIGGTPFTDASFTITGHGDTNNVVHPIPGISGGYEITHDSASINIVGVGNFQFTTATRTFLNDNVTGFSRAGQQGLDLYNGAENAVYAGWDMTTSIGPVAGDMRLLQWDSTPFVFTNAGRLQFDTERITGTFQAIVNQAPVGGVPEPSTVALASLGFVSLGLLSWRFRRQRMA